MTSAAPTHTHTRVVCAGAETREAWGAAAGHSAGGAPTQGPRKLQWLWHRRQESDLLFRKRTNMEGAGGT